MRTSDYRLVVRSDGEAIHVSVDGDRTAASRQIREVTLAAAKLGIPVEIDSVVDVSRAEASQAAG